MVIGMKKRSILPKAALASVLSAILLLSCSSQQVKDVAGEPKAKIDKIEISDIDFEGIELLCSFIVENPYPVGIDLAGYDYDLLVEGSSFVSGREDEGLTVAAGSSSSVQLPISFTYRELRKSVASLEGRERAAYSLELGMDLNIPLSKSTMRISKTSDGTFPVPKLPSVSIRDLVIEKFGNTTIFLKIGLLIGNPNVFEAEIGSVDYLVSVQEREWVSGSTGRSYVFEPQDRRVIYVPLELNYMEVGRTVVDVLIGGRELEYSVSGSSSIGVKTERFEIPSSPFSYEKTGTAAIIRP